MVALFILNFAAFVSVSFLSFSVFEGGIVVIFPECLGYMPEQLSDQLYFVFLSSWRMDQAMCIMGRYKRDGWVEIPDLIMVICFNLKFNIFKMINK